MNQIVRVTTLVENSVHTGGLKGEHGLAIHLQAGSQSILFDTGQSELILENATRLGIALEKLDAIVLSHGHYDHTSGLESVLKIAPNATVYLHPSATRPKYVHNPDGTSRSIGVPRASFESLDTGNRKVITSVGRTALFGGIFATGEIPRVTQFEPPEPSFYLDEACTKPDVVIDDQALYFDSDQGVVVVLGCAHSGVVNTLEHIRKLTNNRPFHALLGGMHLLKRDKKRIESTLDALRKFNFKMLAPAHCTGAMATAMIWTSFEEKCFSAATGTSHTFQMQSPR
jgi:7,8-dihydropterin-6-yl-methyl-4-(beta-D-ribofuranosyl)aminobenzene 5'-phosphate synthase